jgi:hypothetical protein
MLRSPDAFLREGSKVFRAVATDKSLVRSLIEAAQWKANDVEIEAVSLDTRVEAAYDAVFDCCLAVINAAGFRVSSAPGHHEQALEAACALIGASERLFDNLDALRDVRNQKYTGARRADADLEVAKRVLSELSELAIGWLQQHHKHLLSS